MIVDAANTMFNQSSTSVVIRTPQPDDAEVVKKKSEPVVAKASKPEIKEEKPTERSVTPTDTENSSEEKESVEKQRLESDQEKMVLELFDGKYIE